MASSCCPVGAVRGTTRRPTADPEARTFLQNLLRFLITSTAERSALKLLVLRDYGRTGLGRLRQEVAIAFADRIEDKLPRITAPTLVVRGEHRRQSAVASAVTAHLPPRSGDGV